VLANGRLCELVGRAPEELYRLGVRDVTHPDDLRGNWNLFERAVCRGEPFVVEKRYVRPDGSQIWVRAIVTAIRDEAGASRSVLGVAVDITAQKRAEEELRRARDELEEQVRARTAQLEAERARLEEVFRLAPGFMAVLRRPDHIFERANERFYELVGRRDILGRPARAAFPEVEGQGYFELLDRVYQTGRPSGGKGMTMLVRRNPEGPPEEIVFELVYQPLRGPDGAVSGILIQGIDRTDRARAEEVLRQQAELLDLATDAIIVHEPAGRLATGTTGPSASTGGGARRRSAATSTSYCGQPFPGPAKRSSRRSPGPATGRET
jgi:PAS domain S-box-containing protein